MNESNFKGLRLSRYYRSLEPLFKSKDTQAYTMVIMSLFTITFFGLFAIKPTLKTITSLQRQITDKGYLNQKLDEKINSLILAQESYQEIESDLPFIYSLLPDSPNFPSLLRKLEILTVQHNVSIIGIQFDKITLYGKPAPAKLNPATLPTASPTPSNEDSSTQTPPSQNSSATSPVSVLFNLTITGSYEDLTALIEDLTKLDRIVTINSLDFGGKKEAQVASLNISFQSESYYFPLAL